MIEELRQIDDSVLTSLLDLRRERDALRQRLVRMQESASQVSEQILERVRSDYEARIAALDDRALPLKKTARATYARLKPLLDSAQAACDSLRLDQEELELRHSLGEFDDAEHEERASGLAGSLRAAEESRVEIAGYFERFAGAFDSPDELASASTSQVEIAALPAAAQPVAPPPIPAVPGARLAEPHDDDGTLMLPPEPPAPELPPTPAPGHLEAELSPPRIAPPGEWQPAPSDPGSAMGETISAGFAPVSAADQWHRQAPGDRGGAYDPNSLQAAGESEPATSGMPSAPPLESKLRARLEALDSDLDPQAHLLEPLTFIGRTPENQVRIYKPAVSRRHAQITETDAGWLLRDLSSENGTYVNGQRITERLLADGDRIQFGTSRFVLRLAI